MFLSLFTYDNVELLWELIKSIFGCGRVVLFCSVQFRDILWISSVLYSLIYVSHEHTTTIYLLMEKCALLYVMYYYYSTTTIFNRTFFCHMANLCNVTRCCSGLIWRANVLLFMHHILGSQYRTKREKSINCIRIPLCSFTYQEYIKIPNILGVCNKYFFKVHSFKKILLIFKIIICW